MADKMYPSELVLGLCTEIARRKLHCAFQCTDKQCQGCYKSPDNYLDRQKASVRVAYYSYMRAKPMLDKCRQR